MPLATKPLIDRLTTDTPDLKQIWYADDATAAGKISDLKKWWDNLAKLGPVTLSTQRKRG